MRLFAVSVLEKLKNQPPEIWLKVGIAVLAVLVVVFVVRRILQMNKVIAGVLILVVGAVVFFSWVYNRNEPKFLTPIVRSVAPFFPSAGAYATKQQQAP
jgi:drug/metabolite transporter (DMT)-like permease